MPKPKKPTMAVLKRQVRALIKANMETNSKPMQANRDYREAERLKDEALRQRNEKMAEAARMRAESDEARKLIASLGEDLAESALDLRAALHHSDFWRSMCQAKTRLRSATDAVRELDAACSRRMNAVTNASNEATP